MKKDISMPKVEGVYIAVIQEKGEANELVWNVYLVNDKEADIENVFVSSKGYLQKVDGGESKTTTLRRFLKDIPKKSSLRIEPIMEDVFVLNNEYFLSFYLDGVLYDKKFVFLAESIAPKNFSMVPVMDKKGIWIK